MSNGETNGQMCPSVKDQDSCHHHPKLGLGQLHLHILHPAPFRHYLTATFLIINESIPSAHRLVAIISSQRHTNMRRLTQTSPTLPDLKRHMFRARAKATAPRSTRRLLNLNMWKSSLGVVELSGVRKSTDKMKLPPGKSSLLAWAVSPSREERWGQDWGQGSWLPVRLTLMGVVLLPRLF